MEQLITLLTTIAPLPAELEAHLREIIGKKTYKKGEIILPLGSICNDIFYIEKGLVRSFYLNQNEEEVSNWFVKERDICIAVLSFLEREPAMEVHVALEDCLCWGISHAELEETYSLFPKFERHGRIITGAYYCRSERRRIDLNMRSALERYEILMDKDPDLALRVPNKYLASYLGVSVRTLGDIKNQYSDKNIFSNGKKTN